LPKAPQKPTPEPWADKVTRGVEALTDRLAKLDAARSTRPGREAAWLDRVTLEHARFASVAALGLLSASLLIGWLLGSLGAMAGFLALCTAGVATLIHLQPGWTALHQANLIVSGLGLLSLPFGSVLAALLNTSSEHGLRGGGLGGWTVWLVLVLIANAAGSLATLWRSR
jgi:hypothetical protein